MTSRIDIIAPSTITLLGNAISAFDAAPLSLTDSSGDKISVTIIAGNEAARLGVSISSGAVITTTANTLGISGNLAQLNAALAALTLTDTGPDTLVIKASDSALLSATTDIAVNTIPLIGPAFAAPPSTLSLSPYQVTSLSGLVLGDPAATALAAAGLGALETMQVTLSAASGVLLLPGLSTISGVDAVGVGTANILLSFTVDQLSAVNNLLAGLEWAGPAAISGLAYAARNVSGPLGTTITSGNITLEIVGVQGPVSTIATGVDSAILGVSSFGAGALNIDGAVTDIGGFTGSGTVFIVPDASLEVPYNQLSLSGTSFDFGTLAASALTETGTLIVADGASFSGLVSMGSAALMDFAGSFTAGGNIPNDFTPSLSLATGAIITGSGNLVAGNFSESGLISGAGTIIAEGGDTLVIAAGEISGTRLQIAAGGVLALGPLAPLYGVFDATALSVASSVDIAFLNDSGAQTIAGGFADTLAQTGGVLVMNSPQAFSGTITNFAPGDRIILPGLTGLTLLNVTANNLEVAGIDSDGITQLYTLNLAYAAGASIFASTDAQGDGEISLRDASADVFLNGATVTNAAIMAMPGIAQPLQGLDILPRSWTGQSLNITLAVSHGILNDGGSSAEQLTISAASPTALNAELAALTYTATLGAVSDLLSISSNYGLLAGLDEFVGINLNLIGGTVTGAFGDAGQAALFADTSLSPLTGQAAPGELIVTGSKDFANALMIDGLSGTALLVNENGTALFDGGANVALGGNVIIGGTSGAGTLDVFTDQFSTSQNLTIASGDIQDFGAVTIAGSLWDAATINIAGWLSEIATTITGSGTIIETANAKAKFGTLINDGVLDVWDSASATAATLNDAGVLQLGGAASLSVTGAVQQTGTLVIGPDATVSALSLGQTSGAIFLDGALSLTSSLVSGSSIILAGGTLLAPVISLSAGGSLDGNGIAGASGALGSIVLNGGNIIAAGNLTLSDDIVASGTSNISIEAFTTLDLVHGMTGGAIDFSGGSAELTINDLAQMQTGISNMLDHDGIDLIGVAPSLVSFSSGSISATDANGVALGGFALQIAANQPAVQIISDGHGGSLITLGGDMPCFVRGTGLLTPTGYRPVESFKPEDPIITLDGARRRVCWIGRRTLDLACAPSAYPVRFAPGALGPGVPVKPVYLSPLHAVYLGGLLVPACHLVNGATITQQTATAVTYYHIELDRHDVLLADGMASESYLDTGNRGQLYHETGIRSLNRTACAPLVTSGPQLANIRRALHQIALEAGFTLTYHAGLRGVAAQKSLVPRQAWKAGRRLACFKMPVSSGTLGLAVRSSTPADTDPESEDRRQLGICLAVIPKGAILGTGWFPKAEQDRGIWMGGAAELHLSGSIKRDLTLSLAAVIQSWVEPAPRRTIDLRGRGS